MGPLSAYKCLLLVLSSPPTLFSLTLCLGSLKFILSLLEILIVAAWDFENGRRWRSVATGDVDAEDSSGFPRVQTIRQFSE